MFVRDLVLPVEIGAYAHERGHTQRVRFNVDVEVSASRGRRHALVFSYDVIMDAIKIILAAGHVELVETIAERLAESVLLHERVRAVEVQVEKLDIARRARRREPSTRTRGSRAPRPHERRWSSSSAAASALAAACRWIAALRRGSGADDAGSGRRSLRRRGARGAAGDGLR